MSHAPSLCGVILAAGESTRMGRDKALLPWPPALAAGSAPATQTFLTAAIQSFMPFTDMVIVVTGKNASSLEPLVYATGAQLAQNPAPERGQFSSLQVGLHEVMNRGRDAAMVTLVDRPPVSAATLQTLIDAFAEALGRRQWSVVPEYEGKHGHPILIGREMIELFLRAPATATARDIEHLNRQHITYLPVADPFVTMNVDTPEDYAAISASASAPRK
jgi:molybdenum cofactor cytidylyltransferase